MQMKKISEQQKDNVAILYQNTKLKVYEIAKITDVSALSVMNIIKQKDISPRRMENFDEDELERALLMYEAGYRLSEILSQCEIPQNRLYSAIDARGIERRKNICTRNRKSRHKSKKEQIIKMYQEEKSISQIARELDISTDTVKRNIMQAISNGEAQVSKRYSKEETEQLDSIAEIIVKCKNKVTIRDIAKAFKVDEKKLYYRVLKQRRNK